MLRLRALLPALALVPAFALPAPASAGSGCAGADLTPTTANVAEIRDATLCLLNVERRAHGLAPLAENGSLETAATKYSRQMVRDGFFDHVSPGGSTMVQRIKRSNYLQGANGWAIGENIAWGSGDRATPRETVSAWMGSAGHRRNILDRGFRHVGVGIGLGAPVRLRASSTAATYTTDFGRRG
jgi:uncharacterized protein YkwD